MGKPKPLSHCTECWERIDKPHDADCWTGAQLTDLARFQARVGELSRDLYQAHIDLGATAGITDDDCQCEFCVGYRAALPDAGWAR